MEVPNANEYGEPSVESREARHARIAEIVASLEEPLESLLRDLREHIDRGEYGLLIGDDASGRIPTLIVRKVIQAVYERNGYPSPETRFVAGSGQDILMGPKRAARTQQLDEYVDSLNFDKKVSGRLLIITEFIYSGTSLEYLAQSLVKQGIPFDIAAVGFRGHDIGRIEGKLGASIYYGDTTLPHIFGKHELGGVVKNSHDMSASPRRNTFSEADWQLLEGQDSINQAREEADKVAQHLIEHYLSNE